MRLPPNGTQMPKHFLSRHSSHWELKIFSFYSIQVVLKKTTEKSIIIDKKGVD